MNSVLKTVPTDLSEQLVPTPGAHWKPSMTSKSVIIAKTEQVQVRAQRDSDGACFSPFETPIYPRKSPSSCPVITSPLQFSLFPVAVDKAPADCQATGPLSMLM